MTKYSVFNTKFHVKKILITSVSKERDRLIDYACGKAGDLSKWIEAKLGFVFGIDIFADNLNNKTDGACVRYLETRKKDRNVPDALFVEGGYQGLAKLSDEELFNKLGDSSVSN